MDSESSVDWERPPAGVSREAWDAARDIYGRREEIDGHEMNDSQVAQDSDAGKYTWLRMLADIIDSHLRR